MRPREDFTLPPLFRSDSGGLRRSLVSSVGLKFAEKLYYRNIFPTPFNTKLHRNINGISLYSHQTPPDSGEFGGTQIGRETGIEIFFPRLWRGQYNTRYYFISRKKYTKQESNLRHYKTCALAN